MERHLKRFFFSSRIAYTTDSDFFVVGKINWINKLKFPPQEEHVLDLKHFYGKSPQEHISYVVDEQISHFIVLELDIISVDKLDIIKSSF